MDGIAPRFTLPLSSHSDPLTPECLHPATMTVDRGLFDPLGLLILVPFPTTSGLFQRVSIIPLSGFPHSAVTANPNALWTATVTALSGGADSAVTAAAEAELSNVSRKRIQLQTSAYSHNKPKMKTFRALLGTLLFTLSTCAISLQMTIISSRILLNHVHMGEGNLAP